MWRMPTVVPQVAFVAEATERQRVLPSLPQTSTETTHHTLPTAVNRARGGAHLASSSERAPTKSFYRARFA